MKAIGITSFTLAQILTAILQIWSVWLGWSYHSWIGALLCLILRGVPIFYWADSLSFIKGDNLYLHPFTLVAILDLLLYVIAAGCSLFGRSAERARNNEHSQEEFEALMKKAGKM